jgi:hypothetical protein
MKRVLIGLTLALVAGPVAAQAADTPIPGLSWAEVWAAVKSAGIFGTALLGYVLWRVDKERVAYRVAKDAQTEAYIAQMRLDAVTRAKTEELAQKYILGVEAMNATLHNNNHTGGTK